MACMEELFTVDVSDDRGNRIMFKMRKEGNEWLITYRQSHTGLG